MMSKKRKTTELFWTEKKTAEIKMFYFFIHTKKARSNRYSPVVAAELSLLHVTDMKHHSHQILLCTELLPSVFRKPWQSGLFPPLSTLYQNLYTEFYDHCNILHCHSTYWNIPCHFLYNTHPVAVVIVKIIPKIINLFFISFLL